MKRFLTLFLLGVSLQVATDAATYYVSSAGSDSNGGSSASPWLTLSHAVGSVACGDTIVVVANGSYVTGDANLPYFPNCGSVTTVQSSALAEFAPMGWRTSPAHDTNLYGKLQFVSQGIVAQPEAHGSSTNAGNGFVCDIGNVTSSVITIGYCSAGLPNLANGSQVEFEINNENDPTATAVPAPLTLLQHYYVVNCTGICGTNGSSFQVASSPGGAPITITACDSHCVAATMITEPMQVNLAANTMTSPDGLTVLGHGSPVTFGSVGFQAFGTLPSPLQMNVIYYLTNVIGGTFQVSATLGGPPIILTTVGVGPSSISDTRVPSQWAFRGLELVEKLGSPIYTLMEFGSGSESSTYGMVNHMEVDRCWLHDNPADANGPNRGIADNGMFLYVHDSYISGMTSGEAQAIAGWGSPGPTSVVNNFLEASGENTLYGGNWNNSGTPNADKVFSGNYYYKPPMWKITTNTGPASGSCWYDSTDPDHTGGEFYVDTNANQNYMCTPGGTWATTTAPPPTSYIVKNMAEHKNGQFFQYIGNVFNYNWVGAQQGQAFAFHQDYGSGPGFANDHITVMNNKVMNVLAFTSENSQCFGILTLPCINLPVQHTFINNVGVLTPEACGVLFTTGAQSCGAHMFPHNWDGYGEQGEFWNHNTVVIPDGLGSLYPYNAVAFYATSGITTSGTRLNFWTYKNSIIGYDFSGDSYCGGAMFANYFTNATFTRIVSPHGGVCSYGGAGSSNSVSSLAFPANNAAVGYLNFAAGDYHLTASSPYSAQNPSPALLSDDGTDIGADIDLANMAVSGAIAGTPSWDQAANLHVSAGSTQAVFRYTAPTADACTATVYNAPARIAGNQVASSADSSITSFSDGLSRQLYISGLSSYKQYWYKLACGGGVLIVGDFLTFTAADRGTELFTFDWNSPTAMRYSSSPHMTSPVSLPASNRQTIPVGANSVAYVQVGTNGPITILVTP